MFSPTPEVVFDEETVIALHDALVAKTGGSEGVRDRGASFVGGLCSVSVIRGL